MRWLSILVALCMLMSTSAHAGLLGSTVTTQYYAYGGTYDGSGSPATFVADGTAQNQFLNYYTLSVTDTQVIYSFLSEVTWSPSSTSLNENGLFITNGNLLTFAGAPTITGVSFDALSFNDAGIGLTFTGNQIAIDWQNVSFASGSQVILNVTTGVVPEPDSLAFMLAGLGLMSVLRRRVS